MHPLAQSLERLADVLQPGAPLVIDEMDVVAFDRRAAEWWLRQQAVLGQARDVSPQQLVDEHRAHLHPLDAIVAALTAWFDLGAAVRGPWLYRWDLGASFRDEEERLISVGQLPAVGRGSSRCGAEAVAPWVRQQPYRAQSWKPNRRAARWILRSSGSELLNRRQARPRRPRRRRAASVQGRHLLIEVVEPCVQLLIVAGGTIERLQV